MLKRLFDVAVSLVLLALASPVLLVACFLVWRQDGHSPFYIAPRVAKGGGTFRMVKLRSMTKNADKTGVDSTGANDMRITAVGRWIRRYKLDELTQLWNVLKGDMSLVGPRPNVQRETDLYSQVERGLLDVRPGITDFASIVFADEGDILAPHADPDLAYNQLIRPWKSRLGLFYVQRQTLAMDLRLCLLTAAMIVSRAGVLAHVSAWLRRLGADEDLVRVSLRQQPLVPTPPPGLSDVVQSRG
ncbi:sugar transferase [Caenimonas sedimenti]|uniref:Sugar transferase n=1 Tax=Caenimonas sedimenti TaxID=2596921 RepID=A0A562ZF23_9BURK|nr:sugar transferase [Caenimonas sedimenti]TWO66151.1 sugar transferase [Caenimonas sedimenti]